MNLDYKITTAHPDKLRTLHILVIDGELISTTKANELRQFAKNRGVAGHHWKELKEAIRLGNHLSIKGGI